MMLIFIQMTDVLKCTTVRFDTRQERFLCLRLCTTCGLNVVCGEECHMNQKPHFIVGYVGKTDLCMQFQAAAFIQ